MAKELAVIIPTYREKENLPVISARLQTLLEGVDWELIFVDDDSKDGSREELLRLSRENPRFRFIRRIGRRGLASACIEGMCATSADLLAVMDADLQHDETILPEMVGALQADDKLDLAVATRYASTGGVGDFSRGRLFMSKMGTVLEKKLLQTSLSDPMSGFFVMRRESFEAAAHRATGRGFKILLDLVLSSPRPLQIREFPYTFRSREFGESKLDFQVGMEFLLLLADKLVGRLIPIRFIFYILVGLSGLVLHLIILGLLHYWQGWEFFNAQLAATVAAMVSNFLINNLVTFRTQSLKGALLVPGVVIYIIICGIGAITNLQVAEYLFRTGTPWWFAGTVGAGIGAVWNYAVSTQVVWTWFRQQFSPRPQEIP